jgi:hypothetical protein
MMKRNATIVVARLAPTGIASPSQKIRKEAILVTSVTTFGKANGTKAGMIRQSLIAMRNEDILEETSRDHTDKANVQESNTTIHPEVAIIIRSLTTQTTTIAMT